MNVTYNNKPAIMRRNGQVVLGDAGGITFQFIAIDLDGNELGATEQIKVESVSTETVTEVQATFLAKLATPQNVTANGTTVSWDAVENATSYDVYADDTVLLGSVASQSSVDLTTLSGWATLAPGKHTLQIVARAGNYIDSDKSEPIEFEIPPDYLCFTAEEAGSTVAMAVEGTPTKGQAFETSTNRTNWSVFTPGTTTITLANAGDKVYFRGNNTTVSESYSIYYNFVMSGKIAASGNIMSLLDTTCKSTTISNNYCYSAMFYGCTSLTTAPALPATNLANDCYSNMFSSCTSLTTAPELPATTLADYCYSNMFSDCTSLTTAPALPATNLANDCYSNMFYGCTSLTTAPALSATTLANDCYSSMFADCASLTTASALPATTLADYCYSSMFAGCTSLTTAPELPATTLADNCCSNMFYGCTSLTTAPELPATTLASSCYSYMFFDCSKLKVNTTSGNKIFTCPTTIPTEAVTDMFTNTCGTFTGTPTTGETYYYTE